MKVLHVVASMDPKQGGPPPAIAQLAAEQSATCNVSLLSPAADEPHLRHWVRVAPGLERVTWHGIAARAPRRLAEVVRSSDLVHVHGLWQPLPTLAGFSALRHARPLVVSPHGMMTHWCMARRPLRKRIAMLLGWRRLLDGAAAVHALTDLEGRELTAYCRPRRVIVIPNGIDLASLGAGALDAGAVVDSVERATADVLFLGRLHPMKGVDVLVDAFAVVAAEHLAARLLLAGPDYGSGPALQRRVLELGLSDRVRFLGTVGGEIKLALLRDATVMCQPSRAEGFSMSLVEALACGLPVITTRAAGFPEIERAGAGIVTDGAVDAVASALGRVLSDRALQARMADSARRLVVDSFQAHDVAARWCVEYARLTEPSTRAADFASADAR